MFSDKEIRRLVEAQGVIFPFPEDRQFQPVSVDLTLGAVLGSMAFADGGYWLEPGQFILGSTSETVTMPTHIVGQVHGKSTLARMGLLVECAGLIDPGFIGEVTLELKNLNHARIKLELGMPVCQISFSEVSGYVERPYGHPDLGSHYQNQVGPTGARF